MTEIVSVTPGKGNYYIGATETKIKVGTKIDEIEDEKAKAIFNAVDTDEDGVIDQGEMDEAAEIYERLKMPKGKINDAADRNFLVMFTAGLCTLLGTVLVAVSSKKVISNCMLSHPISL